MPQPTSSASVRSLPAVSRFAVTAVAGLALDLYSKWWSFHRLAIETREASGAIAFEPNPDNGGIYQFLPGWLHFHITSNHGAVFGLGQGKRWLFVLVSVAAVGFLVYLFSKSGRQRAYQFILGLLMAGVLGNMYDRMRYGFVRDMIYGLPGWKWPGAWSVPLINYPSAGRDVFPWIFNVADTFLCAGVGLMIVYSLLYPHPAVDGATATPQPAKA